LRANLLLFLANAMVASQPQQVTLYVRDLVRLQRAEPPPPPPACKRHVKHVIKRPSGRKIARSVADRWLAEQGDVQRERQNYAGAKYDRAYDQPVDKRGHRVFRA
jgi:hypothetical protein